MFTVPLKQGEQDALFDPNTVVLSEDSAIRFFGDENPIGQALIIESESGVPRSFTVGAVTDRFPIASVTNFSILMAFDQFEAMSAPNEAMPEPDFYSRNVRATFLQLNNASDKAVLEPLLMAYADVHTENLTGC